ncbi:MAG: class I SAM-dependent methyltransferase [Armatimonadetes bacterium]|nr:class I SAM-dependent methyltransferase [Armatimonadota bacterium]
MSNYLETIYFRDEYDENSYPQKLCDYLIKQIIKPHYQNIDNKNLLDIGSGKGNHLVGFNRRGFKVFGIDKRDECIEILDQFDIRECDIEKEPFPFEENSMDLIFSKSVLEHVVNADNFLSQTYHILKPGGLAILMCPDWGTQYKIYWDDYTHVKAWTRKGLQNAMKIHNFIEVKCGLFRQLPILWKHPFLSILSDLTAMFPESFKWRDKEESDFREWIRFSKEKMLLATGVKLNE